MKNPTSIWKWMATLLVAVGFMAGNLQLGEAAPNFTFLTPWNDSSSNFMDLSGLNDGPAGAHGFIIVKNGHFVESTTGTRVRFLGTNLVFDGVFPTQSDAADIAAHLAKYGINVVRLHHFDNTFGWTDDGSKIWDLSAYPDKHKDHLRVSSSQLDKMDYLVNQLEQHGIYIDMCLHVSRKFTDKYPYNDGFPAGIDLVPFPFDKRVDIYDPQMIADDQQYFHDLLTHLNPYTGKTYASDPGLLDVEINNENSLMGLYGDTPGSNLWALPDPYSSELTQLWNAWLYKKYTSRHHKPREPERKSGAAGAIIGVVKA